jgi:hypothetical protein
VKIKRAKGKTESHMRLTPAGYLGANGLGH